MCKKKPTVLYYTAKGTRQSDLSNCHNQTVHQRTAALFVTAKHKHTHGCSSAPSPHTHRERHKRISGDKPAHSPSFCRRIMLYLKMSLKSFNVLCLFLTLKGHKNEMLIMFPKAHQRAGGSRAVKGTSNCKKGRACRCCIVPSFVPLHQR